jgi:hypothetical protein
MATHSSAVGTRDGLRKPVRTSALVTDSRFFSQEFNTAIIDGPLRIYFSDRQESEALHIYFDVQQALEKIGKRLSQFPLNNPHLYLMLYPTRQSFINVFNWEDQSVYGKYDEHLILGVDCSEGVKNYKNVSQELCNAFEFSIQSHGLWPTIPGEVAQ